MTPKSVPSLYLSSSLSRDTSRSTQRTNRSPVDDVPSTANSPATSNRLETPHSPAHHAPTRPRSSTDISLLSAPQSPLGRVPAKVKSSTDLSQARVKRNPFEDVPLDRAAESAPTLPPRPLVSPPLSKSPRSLTHSGTGGGGEGGTHERSTDGTRFESPRSYSKGSHAVSGEAAIPGDFGEILFDEPQTVVYEEFSSFYRNTAPPSRPAPERPIADTRSLQSFSSSASLSGKELTDDSDVDPEEDRDSTHDNSPQEKLQDPNSSTDPFEDGPIHPWRVVKELPKAGSPLYCEVCFSLGGKYMAVTSCPDYLGICCVYDTTSWELYRTLNNVGPDIVFSPNGHCLARFNPKKPEVLMWDMSTRKFGHTFEAETVLGEKTFAKMVDLGYQVPFSFSPDGNRLAVVSKIGSMFLWNVSTGKRHCLVQPDPGSQMKGWARAALGGPFVTGVVTFSQTGKLVTCGSRSYGVVVRNADTGMILHRLQGHTDTIERLKFSDDNAYLVSCGRDRIVKTWQLSSRSSQKEIKSDYDFISSPNDGFSFAVLSTSDGKAMVRTFQVRIGECTEFPHTKIPHDRSALRIRLAVRPWRRPPTISWSNSGTPPTSFCNASM